MKQMIIGCMMSMMMCSVCLGSLAQTAEDWTQKERAWKEKAKDAYVFPVRPGMPEWAKFQTNDEMLATCQIPDKILKAMTTRGLVETYLNYPMLSDLMFFDSLQAGLNQIILRFNGLQELLNRQDSGTILLERYKAMDPEQEYRHWKEAGMLNAYTLGLSSIEALLAHESILAKMSESTKISLLQESLRMFRAKKQSEHYSIHSRASSLFIMAKILEKADYLPFKQRIAAVKHEDVETITQRILKDEPSMKNEQFTAVSLSGHEKYQQFLQFGGTIIHQDLVDPIVLSAEQHLLETRKGGDQQ